MNKLLINYATGKRVLILFILANLVYVVMIAFTIPKVMLFADGMKLPDMMPAGYDFEYIKALFTALGDEGRHVYLWQQIPPDLVYPALFALSYSLLLAYFIKKLKPFGSPLFFFCWLPLIGGTADYLENMGIITLLNRFPAITEQTVQLTSMATVIKSSATTIYFLVLLVVLIAVGIHRVKRKM
jgi:hypothetical protein